MEANTTQIPTGEGLTFEKVGFMFQEVKEMFRETDKKFQENALQSKETDQKFQATDKQFQDTKLLMQNLSKELGGIGNSNGEIAEDFFYTALQQSMCVGKLKFDYIDRNMHRDRNNIEGEFDIVLYNHYKVLIVEVKYNFRMDYLRDFYEDKLKVFRSLYPEYKDLKIFGAIAAMTFEKGVKNEAEKFGFYVLTQNNDKLKIANKKDFEPNAIK